MISLAFYTFMLQLFLCPLVLLFLIYYCFKMMVTKGHREVLQQKKRKRFATKEIPVLKLLSCPHCGGALSLRNNTGTCPYCSTPVNIPTEYLEIGKLRNDLANKLRKSEKYWRRSAFFTSPGLRWTIRLLYLWIIAAFVICCMNEESFLKKASFLIEDTDSDPMETFIVFGFCTTMIWVVLLMVTAGSISRKARKLLPVMIVDHTGKAEELNCGTCGNLLHFKKGDLVQLCDYCGVETYRAKLAVETKNAVNENRQQAGFSLVEAMEAYSNAVEEMLMTPAILVFIFLVLPFFMIVLPSMLWNFITEHVLPVSLASLVLLLIGYLVYRYKRNKVTALATKI